MSSGLGQLNAYIVVNADDIAVYDYEEIMSGNFPNYRRKTNEKGFEIATNAKNIFRKWGVPEEYQRIIIGVNKIFIKSMLFDTKPSKGWEVFSGIPYYLEGQREFDNFVISGLFHPKSGVFIDYYGSKLEFNTIGDAKSYSWVLNFYKELRDTGCLEAYKSALSDIYGLENNYFFADYKPDDAAAREKKLSDDSDNLGWIPSVGSFGEFVFPYNTFGGEIATDFSKLSKEEKRKILSSYGVRLDDADFAKAVIKAMDKKTLSFGLGTKDVTIDLNDKISNLPGVFSASITVYNNESKDFLEKHYYDLGVVKNIRDAGKKLGKKLDEELEEEKSNRILSGLIKDVKTEYGDYCLVVEEGFENRTEGHFVQLALYQGNAIDENGLVSNLDSCVFSHRDNLDENSQHWQLADPPFSFSNYEVPFGKKDGSKKAVWTSVRDDYRGLIVNGNVKKVEYNNYLEEVFHNCSALLIERELDDIESGFNAVFAGIDESVIVKKRGKGIMIVVKNIHCQGLIYDRIDLKSATFGTITTADLKSILDVLDELRICVDTRIFVTQSIFTYMKSHTGDYVLEGGNRIPREDYFRVGSGPLSGLNYNSLYTLLVEGNASIVVSKILEQLNENFDTAIERVPALTMARKSDV